jgi:hypothetical protein
MMCRFFTFGVPDSLDSRSINTDRLIRSGGWRIFNPCMQGEGSANFWVIRSRKKAEKSPESTLPTWAGRSPKDCPPLRELSQGFCCGRVSFVTEHARYAPILRVVGESTKSRLEVEAWPAVHMVA